MMPCNGCDLPAHSTAVTTMTSFRYDGVYYISESKGLRFCIGTMMTMVLQIMFMMKEIFKYAPDEVDDAIFSPILKMERYACAHL